VHPGVERAGGDPDWSAMRRGGSTASPPPATWSMTVLPAAARPSIRRPAADTASIVPRTTPMPTFPTRSVSSTVSASFWNGEPPAARSANFDSRNSM